MVEQTVPTTVHVDSAGHTPSSVHPTRLVRFRQSRAFRDACRDGSEFPSMTEDFMLLNPTTEPVTDEVSPSMADPMVSHRSAEFEAVYERARDGLDYVFEHSSLSGGADDRGGWSLARPRRHHEMGMEATVANPADEDSEAVSLVSGKFGRHFARIADRSRLCVRASSGTSPSRSTTSPRPSPTTPTS